MPETRGSVAGDDRAAVVAIAGGDVDALAKVWRRHGGRVWVAAARICGGAAAEDAVQEVFLALWRRPEAFDGGRGSLRTFLVIQARARAVDMLRSQVAAERRDRRWMAEREVPQQAAGTAGWTENDRIDVQAALARLPSDERAAILLAYFGGRTYREVAALLGQPEGTIKSRIRMGLRRLGADDALVTDPSVVPSSPRRPQIAPPPPTGLPRPSQPQFPTPGPVVA